MQDRPDNETTPPEEPVDALMEILLQKQAVTLPAGYEKRSASEMTFDPRLAYELALDMDKPLEVFARYGYDEPAARAMLLQKVFVTTVKKYKDEIVEGGISFKLKAKIQAEDLLTHSYSLAVDPTTPATVRASLIQWTTKVAGLEPTPQKDAGAGTGNGFQLNITFAGQPAAVVNAQRVIEEEKE